MWTLHHLYLQIKAYSLLLGPLRYLFFRLQTGLTMGFSSSLQGEAAHEALISRQDAELRLLDNMKRCLSLRVKCDREYAIALNTVVLQVCFFDKSEFTSSKLKILKLNPKWGCPKLDCHYFLFSSDRFPRKSLCLTQSCLDFSFFYSLVSRACYVCRTYLRAYVSESMLI